MNAPAVDRLIDALDPHAIDCISHSCARCDRTFAVADQIRQLLDVGATTVAALVAGDRWPAVQQAITVVPQQRRAAA